MNTTRMKALFSAGAISAATVVPGYAAFAQDELQRSGFALGAAAGYGAMNLTTRYAAGRSGTFALDIDAGYALGTRVILGVELGGWTLSAYNRFDPNQGESVSNRSVFARYFPLETLPVYLSAGGGQTTYLNNAPATYARDKGTQRFVGAGYEYRLTGNLFLAPQIRYARGDFAGGNFRVTEIAVGVNWYSGKVK